MEAPSQSIQQEAKQLNVRIEQEADEWIAILPGAPGEDELGLPAKTEQEALDEARAYRAIETSSVYKFDYDEKRDVYTVSFGDEKFEGKLLAPTYAKAQKAYAEHINQPEPPAPEPAPPAEKQARKRRAGNGQKEGDPRITSGPFPARPTPPPPVTPPFDPSKPAQTGDPSSNTTAAMRPRPPASTEQQPPRQPPRPTPMPAPTQMPAQQPAQLGGLSLTTMVADILEEVAKAIRKRG
jgi:hypothetical protein